MMRTIAALSYSLFLVAGIIGCSGTETMKTGATSDSMMKGDGMMKDGMMKDGMKDDSMMKNENMKDVPK